MTAPSTTHDAYAADLVPLAARLIGAVRHEGHGGVRAVFDQLRRRPRPAGVHPAEALAVILAAMVDDTKPTAELLAWTGQTPNTEPPDVLRAAHAEYNWLIQHRMAIPPHTRALERAYARHTKRAQRARLVHNQQSPVDNTAA